MHFDPNQPDHSRSFAPHNALGWGPDGRFIMTPEQFPHLPTLTSFIIKDDRIEVNGWVILMPPKQSTLRWLKNTSNYWLANNQEREFHRFIVGILDRFAEEVATRMERD